jgi:hypothetical protein
VIVIDEYLAVRVVLGRWPAELPDEDLALPASRHWRLLQALHNPRGGQLSRILAPLSESDRAALRWPHPEVLQVIDPRPLLDKAAQVAASYGGTGWLVAESLAAGLAHGRQLYFGTEQNVGNLLARAAGELGIAVQVAT